jgi:hypothetical protein
VKSRSGQNYGLMVNEWWNGCFGGARREDTGLEGATPEPPEKKTWLNFCGLKLYQGQKLHSEWPHSLTVLIVFKCP